MEVMSSAAAGGDEAGGEDEDDESKTGMGTRDGAGRGICDESSRNLRNLTPSLFMAGLIFSRLKGTRPALSFCCLFPCCCCILTWCYVWPILISPCC